MTPGNALFRHLYAEFEEYANVYDYVSGSEKENREYPFIYLQRPMDMDNSNSDLLGESQITASVYGLRMNSEVVDQVVTEIYNSTIRKFGAYGYNFVRLGFDNYVENDNTTVEPLINARVTLRFQYTKGAMN